MHRRVIVLAALGIVIQVILFMKHGDVCLGDTILAGNEFHQLFAVGAVVNVGGTVLSSGLVLSHGDPPFQVVLPESAGPPGTASAYNPQNTKNGPEHTSKGTHPCPSSGSADS